MQQFETVDEYYQAMQELEDNRQQYYYQQIENRRNGNNQVNDYYQDPNQSNQEYSEWYYEMKQQQMEQNAADGYGMYGAYVADPEVDDYGVVAMCSALFEVSAQCNVHMNSYNILALYMVSQYIYF